MRREAEIVVNVVALCLYDVLAAFHHAIGEMSDVDGV